MAEKSLLVAVDTNVLYDLAADSPVVWDAIETIRQRLPKVVFVVTSTVIDEMAYDVDNATTREKRGLAGSALKNLRVKWGFQPLDLVPVGHGIAETIAARIRRAGLLPEEEVSDSFIIAEAAMANCTMLLSSDSHIKDIDQIQLGKILHGAQVEKVIIASPAKIVRDFFSKR